MKNQKHRSDPALERAIAAHRKEQASIRRSLIASPGIVRSASALHAAVCHPIALNIWSRFQ
jgi:hypothetical protein